MPPYIAKPPDADGKVSYTDAEHATWSALITRQNNIIQHRACDAFIRGIDTLNLPQTHIPQLDEVNKLLMACTGWQVEAVQAVIPPEVFFKLLANKKFPAATFIRRQQDLDYIKEPDIFHELYGHCPLLTCQQYANFLEAYGKLALAQSKQVRRYLFRLFWFTIEFGLIETDDGLRIYGGGILSSHDETQSALTGDVIHRPFRVMDALRTPYRIDIQQPIYYIINDLNRLDDLLDHTILAKIDKAMAMGDFSAHDALNHNTGGIDGKFAC